MDWFLTFLPQHLRRMRVAYVVLALSLIPTAIVYYRVRANVEARDRARFERAIGQQRAAIEERIPHYVDEMLGLRSLFAADTNVTEQQWQRYLAGIEIQHRYPGIGTLGYLERVTASQKAAFVARHLAQTGGIEPDGDRAVYFPAIYLNQFDPALHGGLGNDHLAIPERQEIMEQARDSGQVMATAKVPLLNLPDGKGTNFGFVLYLPVYRQGMPTDTVAARRDALQGFVFANFESEKLLRETLGDRTNALLDCEVYDGTNASPDQLLYDKDGILAANDMYRLRQQAEKITVPVLNRTWTIYFSSLPEFESESPGNLPVIALICWLTLSFLLFGITYAEVNARARSERITTELRNSEAALAAEKERLAVTLYSIGDGVITTDTDGAILSINKMAEQLTGWSQQEAFGKPLSALFNILDEQTRAAIPNPLAMALRTGEVCGLQQPALLVGRDGVERIIADSAAPIRDGKNNIVGAVVVFRDITAKQKTEAEMLKESKLESVGLLAGGIAHDFNNILQGIIGNLSLARMNAHSTEKMLERLASVEKSALRAKDLTQQLVMFARGGAPIRKRVQLNNSIKDATLFALTGSNVQCEFSLPAESWPVDVDEGQFRQVINNIVLNAVQAMADGGKVEVRLENVEFTAGFLPPLGPGRYVKISVRDHGVGIKPEHLPRIFDPYFTTRKQARGLGLASAYSVIRKHEGQINVESQLGTGTTFYIYLPASLKEPEPITPEVEQRKFFGAGRILIMDDEADILMLLREMLELMGYEVETSKDGNEALRRYQAAKVNDIPFGLVIMDLTIPEGMGGKEAIKRLKELDPDVKAVVSSGYSYDPVMANFREFGFCGVIPKPYVMEDLRRVVAEIMSNSAQPAKTT